MPQPNPLPSDADRARAKLVEAAFAPEGFVYGGPWAHKKAQDEIASALAAVRAEAMEEAAKIAESTRGGFTANIRVSETEQELVRDPDGPWVLNSDVAARIRAGGTA